jgi:predicted branched-subunit amino acid permease
MAAPQAAPLRFKEHAMIAHPTDETTLPTRKSEFFQGFREEVAIVLGIVPFALVCGAAAARSGLSAWQGQAMSLFIFSACGQLIGLGLLANGAAAGVVWLGMLLASLRLMPFSSNLAVSVWRLPRRWKAILPAFLVEQTFVLAYLRFHRPHRAYAHWHLLGAGVMCWLMWQIATALGILLGPLAPSAWQIDFTLPLAILALLGTMLIDKPTLCAAGLAAVLSVLLAGLPFHLNLPLSAAAAVALGLTLERVWPLARRGEGL